ncbi:MAG: DUF2782 domain-containing protein [Xanthomonadales bacterium]|nr:DUF2782 domain-containing protein [Xanthomonadales bacterium]
MKSRIFWLAALLGVHAGLGAQTEAPPAEDAPEPPPLPPKVTTGEQITPTVTIRTDDEGQIIEEYRQNGALYMVKITPKNAPPYYLIDLDGDGQFESDMDPKSPIEAVHWKVAEWK